MEKRGNPPGQDIDTQLPLARNNVLATWACQMLRILAYCSTVGRGRGGIAHLSWGIGSEGTPSPYLPHTHTIHTHTQQRVNLFKLTTCKVYLRLGPIQCSTSFLFSWALMQMGPSHKVTGKFRPINKLCAKCVKPFSCFQPAPCGRQHAQNLFFKVWEVNEPVQANITITKVGNDILKL